MKLSEALGVLDEVMLKPPHHHTQKMEHAVTVLVVWVFRFFMVVFALMLVHIYATGGFS